MALKSIIKFKIVIDQKSLDDSKARIGRLLDGTVEAFMNGYADEGVRQLRQAYMAVGRRSLAPLWTKSNLVRKGNDFFISVYNRAEGMTRRTKSNAPNSTRTFPIAGSKLLNILEGGAKPHKIRAKQPFKNPLQFPIRSGWAQSRSVGSAITHKGIGVGRFAPKFRPDGWFEGSQVNHPGVTGSRFVDAVADRLAANLKSNLETAINQKAGNP